jgi:hypothetical protein
MTVTTPWAADWMWGVPIIVLTVLIHSFGLFVIRNAIRFIRMWISERRHFFVQFASIISSVALALAALHAIERDSRTRSAIGVASVGVAENVQGRHTTQTGSKGLAASTDTLHP